MSPGVLFHLRRKLGLPIFGSTQPHANANMLDIIFWMTHYFDIKSINLVAVASTSLLIIQAAGQP